MLIFTGAVNPVALTVAPELERSMLGNCDALRAVGAAGAVGEAEANTLDELLEPGGTCAILVSKLALCARSGRGKAN